MKVKTHLKAGQTQVGGDLNVTQANSSNVMVTQTSTSTIGGA
jgi:hypothetical protein